MKNRAALEACGEFLCSIGALEEANGIAELLRKCGMELSESNPFRWRALLAAIRQELEAQSMDVVFVFERLLQLDATRPSNPCRIIFESQLFLHLLVERFAVAFKGLDAELFKLESDELCRVDGIYDTCVMIRDKIDENAGLKTFLAAFEKVFEQDEPKDCWDAFYELYRLGDLSFRRDMQRALHKIESSTLGTTKLELAFPTRVPSGPKIAIPRALLENRFEGTRQEWKDLSRTILITEPEYEQEAVEVNQFARSPNGVDWVWPARAGSGQETNGQGQESNVNGDAAESVLSEISDDEAIVVRSVSARPPRAAEVGRAARQGDRRSVQSVSLPPEEAEPGNSVRLRSRRRRRRWSKEEEEALIKGYQAYHQYSNTWVLIKAKYPDVFDDRSNVDLKDKYRNLLRYGKIPRPDSDGDSGNGGEDASDAIVNV